MSALTDAWPAVAGVASGPGVFIVMYRWVIRPMLDQIKLLLTQRDVADARAVTADLRATAIQTEIDALQDKLDTEKDLRRTAEDKVFSLTRITAERDALQAEKDARSRGATP